MKEKSVELNVNELMTIDRALDLLSECEVFEELESSHTKIKNVMRELIREGE